MSSSGLPSSREGSTASLKYDKSNYMNLTNDGLFPGDIMELMDRQPVDDMMLSNGVQNQRHPMHHMMATGDTRSLPNGLPPGSIAKFNMERQPSPVNQQFFVEHLASFPQDVKAGYLTPAEALTKLKKISSGGGLWAQKMSMNISSSKLIMANGETLEVIEEYPVQQISLCITVLDDPMFENLLIFSTKLSQDRVGAVHLFQCKPNEATVISDVINKQREHKARMANGHVNGSYEVSSNTSSDLSAGAPPQITRTEYNLKERHAVARVVEAFQSNQVELARPVATTEMNGNISLVQDAKITRDVEILNKCIEEVENFVVLLKRINEARKQLQAKKRGSKKKKVENILKLQSEPPPDHRIIDVYQKFKHALNLLGKLQPHINDPNAPELIHYLLIPLGIIVKVTGIEKARSVMEPLLTATCVDLLVNCLDSREYHFWQSLGPNWTLTKSSDIFKDRYFSPFMPVFVDGWVPPEIVAGDRHEAAVRTTTEMVARMKIPNGVDVIDTAGPVIQSSYVTAQPPVQQKPYQRRPESLVVNTAEIYAQSQQRNHSYIEKQEVQKRLVGIVVYDYLAHNNKELTIRAGEKVYILDNTRRWWLVRNSHGEQGYVPSTVLEIPTQDSGASSPSSDNSFSMSPTRGTPNGGIVHHNQGGAYSPAYDANQNYMNDHSLAGHVVSDPKKTVTPVVISVQLPEGGRVQSNADGTHIIATPSGMINNPSFNKTMTTGIQTRTESTSAGSPPYAVVKKKVTNQTSYEGGMPYIATAAVVNQANIVHQHNRMSPPKTAAPPPVQYIPAAPVPPPPPPPPPPVAPVVSPKPQMVIVSKEANLNSMQVTNHNVPAKKGSDLQSELKNRLSLSHIEHDKQEQIPNIDAVDVFIPLYKSSTADDVSRWLHKLGFSGRTIDILRGKTALDLFKINKESMTDLIGTDEGLQLYEELQVQNGAQNRHKTLTEFQRALVRRLQKRENQQEIARAHLHGSETSTDNGSKEEASMKYEEQSNAIRKQKEELNRLKESREPGSATFSSFAVNVSTPQGKTKL